MTEKFGPCPPELRLHQDRQMSGDKWHTQITAIGLSELTDMSRCDKRYSPGRDGVDTNWREIFSEEGHWVAQLIQGAPPPQARSHPVSFSLLLSPRHST